MGWEIKILFGIRLVALAQWTPSHKRPLSHISTLLKGSGDLHVHTQALLDGSSHLQGRTIAPLNHSQPSPYIPPCLVCIIPPTLSTATNLSISFLAYYIISSFHFKACIM